MESLDVDNSGLEGYEKGHYREKKHRNTDANQIDGRNLMRRHWQQFNCALLKMYCKRYIRKRWQRPYRGNWKPFIWKKSLTNHLVLKQRLYTFHQEKGESIRDHISEFFTLLNDLKNVEANLDDEDQTILSYKTFKETLI